MELLIEGQAGYKSRLKRLFESRGASSAEVSDTVKEIIAAVRSEGDAALVRYTRQWDGFGKKIADYRIPASRLPQAYNRLPAKTRQALTQAAQRIAAFHLRQKEKSWLTTEEEGVILGQLVRPLARVGLYAPGGKAAYPSSVLMNAMPARLAGVEDLVLVSPAPGGKPNPLVLAAAYLAGVREVWTIGGAQAIAALALGTQALARVDKIVGPGNIYVAEAKRQLFGVVDIDMVAGPSEILVLADETANPDFIAADLLSQAEHDAEAWVALVCTSEPLIHQVEDALARQLKKLPRAEIARAALNRHGFLIAVKKIAAAVELANRFAPEHLEVMTAEPWNLISSLKNAGAIFLGSYAPEPMGDYIAGPNHVLPTGGTARFFSPLSTADFLKKSSLIYFSREAFQRLAPAAELLSELEGLTAHTAALKERKKTRL